MQISFWHFFKVATVATKAGGKSDNLFKRLLEAALQFERTVKKNKQRLSKHLTNFNLEELKMNNLSSVAISEKKFVGKCVTAKQGKVLLLFGGGGRRGLGSNPGSL